LVDVRRYQRAATYDAQAHVSAGTGSTGLYCGAPRGKVPQSTTRASENRLICQAAELGADRNHQHDAAGIGQIFGVVAKG